jgi:hypothetical protein
MKSTGNATESVGDATAQKRDLPAPPLYEHRCKRVVPSMADSSAHLTKFLHSVATVIIGWAH